MNLKIDTLDTIQAPLSDNFWIGFAGGFALVLLIALAANKMLSIR